VIPIPGLTIPDGEVRLEMKPVTGAARAMLTILVRVNSIRRGSADQYAMGIIPSSGNVQIDRIVDGHYSIVARRSDLNDLIKIDDWNRIAVRMNGANIWYLVNDQPVISVVDSALSTGSVGIAVIKMGNPYNDDETAVVLRNLRVSGIAGSEPERMPTYRGP
jgi:hypothetical protein